MERQLIAVGSSGQLNKLGKGDFTPGWAIYRVGANGRLMRISPPPERRCGLMAVDDGGFSGPGSSSLLCRDILRECSARGYAGILCDFGQQNEFFRQAAASLDEQCARQKLALYVPEWLGGQTRLARVLIPSLLSGGSLKGRLEQAVAQFGAPERVTLLLRRCAEDFFLPAPTGSGRALSQVGLGALMERLRPSVFFSPELCCRYFTYTDAKDNAHFVLFDDGKTMEEKCRLARRLGIMHAVVPAAECGGMPIQDAGRLQG